MPIPCYLAMTPAEMSEKWIPGTGAAWMACHFSPYGTGLSNLPEWLPPESLLILNDRTPIHDHDPVLISAQLGDCAARLGCCGILLDFQRPGQEQTRALARYLCRSLPCPLAVSEAYAEDASTVFVSPVPADTGLETHLSRWKGREIWLELGLDTEEISLTEQGAQIRTLPAWAHPEDGFSDGHLHCRYRVELSKDRAVFTLWRTPEDLKALLEEADRLGVTAAVGLYQELHHRP